MHHTKDKGDLGVFKAQVDLAQQGFSILTPLSEHLPFDIVGYKDGRFIRIQVKYRASINGKIDVKFSTNWADKNGSHTRKYNKGEIDYFCVYCPDTDECYYVDPKQFEETLTLRVSPSKNNQSKGIHLCSDYRLIPPVSSTG